MTTTWLWVLWCAAGFVISIVLHRAVHAHTRVMFGAFILPAWLLSFIPLLGWTAILFFASEG